VAGLGYTNNAYASAGGSAKVALTTPLSVSGSTITIPADLLMNGSIYAVEVFRVGAESGFNIVAYTGTGVARTVAHGLDRAPFAVAVMPNDANAVPWLFNTDAAGWTKTLSMLATNAATASSSWWNGTAPTDALVTVGTNQAVNTAGHEYQLWAWSDAGPYREIDYLGAGALTGGGSVASLGGTPEAVMFLKDANGAYNWPVQWAMRSEYNPVNEYIYSNVYNGESAGTVIALLSNGFKTITTNGYNVVGHRHVGVAVVHNPKYRNAY
jgi:hypothetical protein